MGASNLPCAGGEAHAKAFGRLGWEWARTSGSHIIMTKDGETATLSIPCHAGKDVSRFLLSGVIKAAGVTEAEYLKAFRGK